MKRIALTNAMRYTNLTNVHTKIATKKKQKNKQYGYVLF